MENQRVMVIQDASGGPKTSAISWALRGFSLKPGDKLTLLAIVRFVHNPSKSAGSNNLLGYKNKVDSSSMFGANESIVQKAVASRKEEFNQNLELVQISRLYEMEKVDFSIEVASGGALPKVVAVKEAKKFKATWIILDRKIKRDRKYFLQKLSCGVSRMKRNDKIELLRGPKQQTITRLALTYDDMMPGIPEDLFSIEFRPYVMEDDGNEEIEQDQQQQKAQTSTCSLCNNIRPELRSQMEFTYAQLHSATDGFSSMNSLSQAGISSSFIGQIKTSSLKIMVKQHKEGIIMKSELEILTKLRHENVLMLLGSCTHENVRLLVYENACNGSVNHHLSSETKYMNWNERMKVALGAARGLNYLHKNDIVHRNLRSSNVLLTHDFEPKLGDVGASIEHNVLESLEYLAPEYAGTWKHSTATDKYAFGVFLLELITGRKVTDKMPGGKSLVGWARPLLKERRHDEIIDPKVANSHDLEQLYWMSRVTLNCLNKVPEKRLEMDKVVCALEYIADRQSQFRVMEDFCAVKSLLARSSSESMNGVQSNEKKMVERQSFSREIDLLSKSFSSISSATTSRRGSTSFSRSSTSSGMSANMQRKTLANPGNRVSLSYAEML